MSRIRTCRACRAGQILLLPRRVRFGMASRRERLPICSVHGRRLSYTAPYGMCWNKSLRLRRHRRKDTILIEPHAIRAAAVVCSLEARAADLRQKRISMRKRKRRKKKRVNLPCVFCSSDRRWQFAGGELAAGGPGACSSAEEVGLDTGLAAAALESIREGRADDRRLVEGAGEPPCRGEVLGEEEAGATC
jgi:hypothetical protein